MWRGIRFAYIKFWLHSAANDLIINATKTTKKFIQPILWWEAIVRYPVAMEIY